MKRRLWYAACVLFSLAGLASAADKPLTLKVWPGAAPGVTDKVNHEHFQPQNPSEKPPIQRLTDVSVPTIAVFRPAKDKNTGAAVLVCPGGGYAILAWDLEGTEVAHWLNSIGVTAIVLKYRVPRSDPVGSDRQPIGPLQDAQRALSLVRSKAKEWGIDPHRIGQLGFSAGGHLTASSATHFNESAYTPLDAVDRVSCRPDFAVLVYPAYLVTKSGTLQPNIRVTKQTPQTFLAMAEDDPVNVENAVAFFVALKRAHVPAEMHLYATGGHGFGLRPSKHLCSTWPKRCEEWMRSRGFLHR
jgi:acetyl esterase/lipase